MTLVLCVLLFALAFAAARPLGRTGGSGHAPAAIGIVLDNSLSSGAIHPNGSSLEALQQIANGDAANKIGTYSLALAARAAGIPFVVVAPTSTLDPSAADGNAIPVEERDPSEVTTVRGVPTAPAGTRKRGVDGLGSADPVEHRFEHGSSGRARDGFLDLA